MDMYKNKINTNKFDLSSYLNEKINCFKKSKEMNFSEDDLVYKTFFL